MKFFKHKKTIDKELHPGTSAIKKRAPSQSTKRSQPAPLPMEPRERCPNNKAIIYQNRHLSGIHGFLVRESIL